MRGSRAVVLRAAIGCLLLPTTVVAEVPAPVPQTLSELESAIRATLTEHEVPGAVATLVTADDDPWVAGIGLADISRQLEMTPDTLVRLGSISKSFVSLAVLQLVERGDLALENEVRELLPGVAFSNPWAETHPVRLVHLLEHTSGFDDLHLVEYAHSQSRPISLRDGLGLHPHSRVSRWPPGAHMSYSNSGPAMAARVVERVVGEDFETYVARNIFRIVGMPTATFFEPAPDGDLAVGYLEDNEPGGYWHILMRPAGSINASAREMAAFVRMMIQRGRVGERRVVTEPSIARMETPRSTLAAAAGLRSGYGLGNYTSSHGGHLFRGHAGGMDTFLAEYAYAPGSDRGYFFAINRVQGDAYREIRRLLRAYLTREHPATTSAAAGNRVARRELESLAGFFRPVTPRQELFRGISNLLGIQRVVALDDGLLVGPLLGGETETLLPVSDRFFRGEEHALATAAFVAGGRVLQVVEGSRSGNYERVPGWRVGAELGLAALCLLVMASAVVFALFWCLRWLLRRPRYLSSKPLRWWPLIPVFSLVTMVALLVFGLVDPIPRLGRVTPLAVALLIVGWLTVLSATGALLACARTRPEVGDSPWLRTHALAVVVATIVVVGYLAWHDLVPLQSWAY